jgi:hypothetical protein
MKSSRRRRPVMYALMALGVVAAGSLWPASSLALTIDEPLVTGPQTYVHHVSSGGFNGGYDWVYAVGFGEPEINGAVWEESDLPAGPYEVEAWLPNDFGTADARYQITHSGVTSEVLMSQYEFISGEWVVLGAYEFNGSPAVVRSTDSAGEPGDRIDWSDVRWTPVSSLPANVETVGTVTTIREPEVSGPEEFFSRFAAVGYGGGSLLVGTAQGVDSPIYDTASWSVPLTASEYTVEVFVPEAHHEALVDYTVDAAEGVEAIPLNQRDYRGVWVDIGRFPFSGERVTVTSPDATGVAGQDIAWSAMRLTKDAGPSEPVGQLTPTAPVTPPSPGSTAGAGAQSGVLPYAQRVPDQNGLLGIWHRPRRGSHGRGPAVEYEIRRLFPSSTDFSMSYLCEPCLFVPGPRRARQSERVPHLERSLASGNLRDLLHRDLYRGTTIAVEVTQAGYQPLRQVYAFDGAHRPPPVLCERAALKECR